MVVVLARLNSKSVAKSKGALETQMHLMYSRAGRTEPLKVTVVAVMTKKMRSTMMETMVILK